MELAGLYLPEAGSAHGPLTDELLHDAAINRVLAAVRGHLGLEIAFVSRYVEGGQRELTHVDTDLVLPMGPGFREPMEDSYCWHVLQGNLPQLIQDPADFPFTSQLAITDFLPVGAHLNVPLRLADGSVWGSFCALGRKADRTMGERDLNVVRAFAALAAERIEANMAGEAERSSARARVTEMLDGHAITVFHQPIHCLASGEPMGVECLARFPNTKLRGPSAWFEDAEKVGLGVELELAAVRAALETLGQLPPDKYASINVSPATILSGRLEHKLAAVEGTQLVLELTEHNQVEDYAELMRHLAPLRGRVKLAIDDVGTGYAGLRHIVDLQPDMLKMDMALTRDIHRDPARRALAGALVQFSRDIGCKLVAEGIETAEERGAMAGLGVHFGQGYLFARPLPVIAATRHMLGQRDEDDVPDLGGGGARDMPAEADQPELGES